MEAKKTDIAPRDPQVRNVLAWDPEIDGRPVDEIERGVLDRPRTLVRGSYASGRR